MADVRRGVTVLKCQPWQPVKRNGFDIQALKVESQRLVGFQPRLNDAFLPGKGLDSMQRLLGHREAIKSSGK